MKIILSGKITLQNVEKLLLEQDDKKQKIIQICKDRKIDELQYKDSELEFEYKKDEKQFTNPKPKIETRGGVKDGKD